MLRNKATAWYDRRWTVAESECLSANDRERVETILSMIPQNARNILDVGCGDGRVTNPISARGLTVFALDISKEGLEKVQGLRILGDSAHLPLKDGLFDLVVCSEVLEHLPLAAFHDTIEELKRVSKRYILVTVPCEEQLDLHLVRCEECLSVFHPVLHLRSFSFDTLTALFPAYDALKVETSGTESHGPVLLTRLLRSTVGYNVAWDEAFRQCPLCGNLVKISKAGDRLLCLAIMKLMACVRRILPKKPYHLEVLLERRGISGTCQE